MFTLEKQFKSNESISNNWFKVIRLLSWENDFKNFIGYKDA